MHPDLSPHLHNADCNKLIAELQECHKTHTFGKFIGKCNELDTLLLRCLKKEREENRRLNKEKADARNKRSAEYLTANK